VVSIGAGYERIRCQMSVDTYPECVLDNGGGDHDLAGEVLVAIHGVLHDQY
jgi:hypothetical protein